LEEELAKLAAKEHSAAQPQPKDELGNQEIRKKELGKPGKGTFLSS
jgi:hypothetical protein